MALQHLDGTGVVGTLLLNTTEDGTVACNWQDYGTLIFAIGNYNNIRETLTCPRNVFRSFTSGSRIMISPNMSASTVYTVEIYPSGEGAITVAGLNALASAYSSYRLRVFGI